MKLKDLTGQKFGQMTVIRRSASNRQGSSTWECLCDCGAMVTYSSDHLTRKSNPVKSCGCIRKYRKGADHPLWNGCGEISGNWWYNHVARERKQNTRTRVPVEITIKEAWQLFLEQNRKCALTGLPLTFSQSTSPGGNASLDRIDSGAGYTIVNVQWVHKDINFMKGIYDSDYFIEMCRAVANHNP